jgi:hypothetical protein
MLCRRMWQDKRQTSEATECRRRVPQDSSAVEDKALCAKLGTGRADGGNNVC